MSHEDYILFYSIVFTNPIVNPRSHESESESHRTEVTEAKRTEAVTRIEPNTSAALSFIRFALSTELSRNGDNLVQNGG